MFAMSNSIASVSNDSSNVTSTNIADVLSDSSNVTSTNVASVSNDSSNVTSTNTACSSDVYVISWREMWIELGVLLPMVVAKMLAAVAQMLARPPRGPRKGRCRVCNGKSMVGSSIGGMFYWKCFACS